MSWSQKTPPKTGCVQKTNGTESIFFTTEKPDKAPRRDVKVDLVEMRRRPRSFQAAGFSPEPEHLSGL